MTVRTKNNNNNNYTTLETSKIEDLTVPQYLVYTTDELHNNKKY